MSQTVDLPDIIVGEAQAAAEIEKRLLASLAKTSIQSLNKSFVFRKLDDAGNLIGGVTGSTSYGWLLVKTLWVAEHRRGKGLGSDLMAHIETEARNAGCHSAWLDTSNAAARNFYEKLGYGTFGVLENLEEQEPEQHKRWFLKKQLV